MHTSRMVDDQLMCGHPGCDEPISYLVEYGYVRTWSLSFDDGRATAYYDGDWSENDDGAYKLRCYGSHVNQLPDGFEWKWN